MKEQNPKHSVRTMTHLYYIATVASILLLFFGLMHPLPFGYLGAGSMYVAFGQIAFPDYEWIALVAVLWFFGFPVLLTIGYIVALAKKQYKFFGGILLAEASAVIVYCVWCFAQGDGYGGTQCLMEGLFSLGYWWLYRFARKYCDG